MASTQVGSIHYDLGLDTKDFDKASDRLKGKLDTVGKRLKQVGLVAAAATATGFIAASKAAFDQVKAVEEARFGLQAYEKDAKKVDNVLGDLVKFAQTDEGVLFNRRDLFEAASTLKIYGQETETLTDKIKILSRGVSMGKTTFGELSQIVGRAASKGRLDAVDFDMLIERGIGLDRSFRGAAVSSEELFKELGRVLPAELLKGRANTIEGRFIRLQTAFRNVGTSILGVNEETNEFVKGGIGDLFMTSVTNATDSLKGMRGIVEDTIENVSNLANEIGRYLGPKFEDLKETIEDASPTMNEFYDDVLVPIGRVLGTVIVVAIGAVIDAIKLLIEWSVKAYHQIKKSLGRLFEFLRPAYEWFMNNVWPSLKMIGEWVANEFVKTWEELKEELEKLEQQMKDAGIEVDSLSVLMGILAAILVAATAPILFVVAVLTTLALVVMKVFGAFLKLQRKINGFVIEARAKIAVFASNAKSSFEDVVRKVDKLFGGMPSKILRYLGSMFNSGRQLVNGLINGIVSGFGRLMDTVRSMASQVASAFREMLQIRSPSQVFNDFGSDIVSGLVNGIEGSVGMAKDTALGLAKTVSDNFNANSSLSIAGRPSENNETQEPQSAIRSGDININGVTINSKDDADYFFEKINRRQEITNMGITA